VIVTLRYCDSSLFLESVLSFCTYLLRSTSGREGREKEKDSEPKNKPSGTMKRERKARGRSSSAIEGYRIYLFYYSIKVFFLILTI
jgi:hypothetical protein